MKRSEFSKLKKINDDDGFFSNKLKLGEKFLYGTAMKSQIEQKDIGDDISYYIVSDITQSGNVLYSPVMDKLEK